MRNAEVYEEDKKVNSDLNKGLHGASLLKPEKAKQTEPKEPKDDSSNK